MGDGQCHELLSGGGGGDAGSPGGDGVCDGSPGGTGGGAGSQTAGGAGARSGSLGQGGSAVYYGENGGGGGGGLYGGGSGSGSPAGGGGGGSNLVPSGGTASIATGGPSIVISYYIDKTAPTLTVTHTANANGWNNTSSVALDVSASDAGSGLATGSPTCTDGTTDLALTTGPSSGIWTASVSGEGIHDVSCTAQDQKNNSRTSNDTVRIDTSAPSIEGSRSPLADSHGWNNTDVTVGFTCSDNTGGSGVGACSGPTTLSNGGTSQSVTGTVTDKAGNSANATVSNINIDKTAPVVRCSVSPSVLNPPANNHKLQTVTASVSVTDSGGSGTDPIATNRFMLVSVTSNQPQSGLAKDDVANDIQGWTTGTADTSGQLRAERYSGARIYTLTYQGKDVAGNTTNCQATVTVPKG